jgi:AraC-like DNA-binding protein
MLTQVPAAIAHSGFCRLNTTNVAVARLSALPRLLGGERVTTIAYDLGYSSPAAFTVMFKQLVGLSPDAYRRQTSRPAFAGATLKRA